MRIDVPGSLDRGVAHQLLGDPDVYSLSGKVRAEFMSEAIWNEIHRKWIRRDEPVAICLTAHGEIKLPREPVPEELLVRDLIVRLILRDVFELRSIDDKIEKVFRDRHISIRQRGLRSSDVQHVIIIDQDDIASHAFKCFRRPAAALEHQEICIVSSVSPGDLENHLALVSSERSAGSFCSGWSYESGGRIFFYKMIVERVPEEELQRLVCRIYL